MEPGRRDERGHDEDLERDRSRHPHAVAKAADRERDQKGGTHRNPHIDGRSEGVAVPTAGGPCRQQDEGKDSTDGGCCGQLVVRAIRQRDGCQEHRRCAEGGSRGATSSLLRDPGLRACGDHPSPRTQARVTASGQRQVRMQHRPKRGLSTVGVWFRQSSFALDHRVATRSITTIGRKNKSGSLPPIRASPLGSAPVATSLSPSHYPNIFSNF